MKALSQPLRRLIIGYGVNELGTWFGYVALTVAVYDHSHSALATASLLIAARFLPALVVPAIVARAEASRRAPLSALYALEAFATLALAASLWRFWLPAILVLAAIDGMASLAASSLVRAAAARLGSERELARTPLVADDSADGIAALGARRANAALNSAWTPTVVFGPALAGLLVATAGGQVALLLDAVSFLFCAVALRSLTATTDQVEERTVLSRLQALWRHVQGVPRLRVLLATEAVALIFFASVEPVEIVFAKATLHAGDQGFGLLMGSWGVGMLIGSVIFNRSLTKPLGPLLSGGALVVGAGYLAMAAAPSIAIACAAAVLGGTGNGFQWVSLISLVQQMTPPSLHARLMSAVQSMGALCPAIGFALGGGVAALSSPRIALWLAGAASVGAAAVFLRTYLRLRPPITTTEAALQTTAGESPRTPEPAMQGGMSRAD